MHSISKAVMPYVRTEFCSTKKINITTHNALPKVIPVRNNLPVVNRRKQYDLAYQSNQLLQAIPISLRQYSLKKYENRIQKRISIYGMPFLENTLEIGKAKWSNRSNGKSDPLILTEISLTGLEIKMRADRRLPTISVLKAHCSACMTIKKKHDDSLDCSIKLGSYISITNNMQLYINLRLQNSRTGQGTEINLNICNPHMSHYAETKYHPEFLQEIRDTKAHYDREISKLGGNFYLDSIKFSPQPGADISNDQLDYMSFIVEQLFMHSSKQSLKTRNEKYKTEFKKPLTKNIVSKVLEET